MQQQQHCSAPRVAAATCCAAATCWQNAKQLSAPKVPVYIEAL